MNYRIVTSADIPRMQVVRHLVKENILSDPALVTDAQVGDYITQRGKGWVCEVNSVIVGFAIADLQGHSIWALFLQPEFEGQGIGRKLHQLMLDWYFTQSTQTLWLTTSPNTRAERFYRKAGWKDCGYQKREIRFEMTHSNWKANRIVC
ncbi:MAG: family acetyltransferase [Flaviaesturariibacter sp.]|nr:family acetyltransferase [Flaviaesturariibacter sp.]